MEKKNINKLSYRERYEQKRAKEKKRRKENLKNWVYSVLFVIVLLMFFILVTATTEQNNGGYYAPNPDKNAEIHYVWLEYE